MSSKTVPFANSYNPLQQWGKFESALQTEALEQPVPVKLAVDIKLKEFPPISLPIIPSIT